MCPVRRGVVALPDRGDAVAEFVQADRDDHPDDPEASSTVSPRCQRSATHHPLTRLAFRFSTRRTPSIARSASTPLTMSHTVRSRRHRDQRLQPTRSGPRSARWRRIARDRGRSVRTPPPPRRAGAGRGDQFIGPLGGLDARDAGGPEPPRPSAGRPPRVDRASRPRRPGTLRDRRPLRGGLSPTSTMRARPRSSRWVSRSSVHSMTQLPPASPPSRLAWAGLNHGRRRIT